MFADFFPRSMIPRRRRSIQFEVRNDSFGLAASLRMDRPGRTNHWRQGGNAMVNPKLRNINLNLILVLRALLRHGSVSKAADVLGRSPSAISTALSQLRTALEDPLFVRVGSRLQATAKAAALAGPLETICDQLEHFFASEEFQAEHSDRQFVVAGPDVLVYSIGAHLVRTLRRHAPGMSIHFVDLSDSLAEAMAAREIDFALLPDVAVTSLEPAPLKFLELASFEVDTALMDPTHPFAKQRTLSESDLSECKRLGFRPDQSLLKVPVPDWLDSANFTVVASQLLPIPYLVEGTDLVATVTASMAQDAMAVRKLIAVGLEQPYVIRNGLAWSSVFDTDPAHAWFRNAVASAPKPADA
jgi:DNA-binding transcriptional LysR family regulator